MAATKFKFLYQRELPKKNNRLPQASLRELAHNARRLGRLVQGYDQGYEQQLTIQHLGANTLTITGLDTSQGLEQLAQQQQTHIPLAEYKLTQPRTQAIITLTRDLLRPQQISFEGENLEERLVERIRTRFEKRKNGYELITRY